MSPPKAAPKNVPDRVAIKRVLISVSDKTGLVESGNACLPIDGGLGHGGFLCEKVIEKLVITPCLLLLPPESLPSFRRSR